MKDEIPEEFLLNNFLPLLFDENLEGLRHLTVSHEPPVKREKISLLLKFSDKY